MWLPSVAEPTWRQVSLPVARCDTLHTPKGCEGPLSNSQWRRLVPEDAREGLGACLACRGRCVARSLSCVLAACWAACWAAWLVKVSKAGWRPDPTDADGNGKDEIRRLTPR